MQTQTKKHEIQRSNLLIEANYNIPSVDGYRIALMGMSKVCQNLLNNPLDDKALTISIKTKTLKQLFPSFKNAGNIHERIDKATDDIGKNNTAKIYEDEGNWKKIAFIDEMEYKNSDELIVSFNEKTRQYFNTESKFTRYLLNDTVELSSYQQIRVYELCIQYLKIGHRKIGIPTFKKFTGIKQNKTTSKLIQELKACILQINQKTNLEIELETIKTSRKITHIKFKFRRTDLHPLDEYSQQNNNIKSQLIQLGFKQEKLKLLLKISPKTLIQAIAATQKVKDKNNGYKKSMEACFFYQIGIIKDDKHKLEPIEIVHIFKENLNIQAKQELWNEFYTQLNKKEQDTYSEANKNKNETIKKALDTDFNNKYNRWIYETKIKFNNKKLTQEG